jgi:hypothetical protein
MRGNRSGKILLLLVLLPVAAARTSGAQQTSTPSLHQRSDENASNQDQPRPDSASRLPSTLPADASGAYEFDHRNESIELDIDDRNRLSGYISRLGDSETDDNTPLTFFFDRTSVDGSRIQFQTRVVHGVWYSFRGTILRGSGQTRDEEGYYVLHGVLQEHHPQSRLDKSANETIERRTVDFKSLGR